MDHFRQHPPRTEPPAHLAASPTCRHRLAPAGPCRGVGSDGPPPDEVVIRKPSYGAFYGTPLDTMLRNLGRDTVIIRASRSC
ncbi:isochorismatase family protein [Actinomadura sp. 3N508]|uniref:isochorismatase family protein n=1 Tax=Actinomadura sp. 3N508 TaxID=3375153 RepID=UPI00379DF856